MHVDRLASQPGPGAHPAVPNVSRWSVLTLFTVKRKAALGLAAMPPDGVPPTRLAQRVDAEPGPGEMTVEESVIWCAYAAMAR